MVDTGYSLRSAIAEDAANVTALVNAAYGHYVEQIGMTPRPMTDDYAEVIRNSRVTVAEIDQTMVGVIVLAVTDEGFLIDNVAEREWARSCLRLRKPKRGVRGSIPFIFTHTRR